MSKASPILVARKAIDQAFAILDKADHEDAETMESYEILRDARIKLDTMNASRKLGKENAMRDREDETTRKLKRELEQYERDYVSFARLNPQSINDTKSHLASIDKLVRDMKRIRGRLGRSKDDAFLKQLLYPTPPTTET